MKITTIKKTTMNYQHIIEIAKQKLSKDYQHILDEIDELVTIGSTGGEITSMLGRFLIELEAKDINAYNLIKVEIEKYHKSN
jgi:hypothetical protein